MKRSLLVLLAVIVLAGWLGTLIARDPGYVLVSYGGGSLQTSLWVALGLLVALVLASYYGLKLLKIVFGSVGLISSWQGKRKQSRSQLFTSKGYRYLMEQEYERAEKFLVSGANNNDSAATNLVAAATAARHLSSFENAESYLRQAVELDSAITVAATIEQAQLYLNKQDWEQALEVLQTVKSTDAIVNLRKQALLEKQDWQGLMNLLPALKKLPASQQVLTKQILFGLMSEQDVDIAQLKSVYKKLPADLCNQADIVLPYVDALKQSESVEVAEIEGLLRKSLKENWQPEVLAAYASLGEAVVKKQLKSVQGWLKQHPDDAALQLCLGRLYETNGDRELACAAYQKSVDIEPCAPAHLRLAAMLAFDGKYRESVEHYNMGIALQP